MGCRRWVVVNPTSRPHCGSSVPRLAELQEEILWLRKAAHLPVIWATHVLDQLAKSGLPSPAEVSDAAMAERAECVMLNTGPHIDEAVVVLDDILCRWSSTATRRTLHWDSCVRGATPRHLGHSGDIPC
jgi:hypothetical protein